MQIGCTEYSGTRDIKLVTFPIMTSFKFAMVVEQTELTHLNEFGSILIQTIQIKKYFSFIVRKRRDQ